jgi:hypothetical protein
MAIAQTHTLLDAALAYAAKGWRVFPCYEPTEHGCACRRDCGRDRGKHPRTKNGLKDATTDEAQIREWWKRWPTANVAIRTGAESGLVVLDRDDYKGGADSLEELERTYSPLPETVLGLSGGGGQHYCFAHPGSHVKTAVDILGPGLDTRADGGYIIAPPSLHKSGKQYVWEVLHEPDETPLAPLPDWVRVLCQEPSRPSAPTRAPGTNTLDQAEVMQALWAIPGADDYDRWVAIGMALHSTGASWAETAWDHWSQQSVKYEAHRLHQHWQSFHADGKITIGTLFHLAHEAGRHRGNGDTPDTPAPEKPAWMGQLLTLKNGEAKETFNNLSLTLEHLPPWKTDCWYDVVRDCGIVGTAPLDEGQVWAAARAIEPATQMPIRNLKLVMHALRSRCTANKRDVLQEWLASLAPWDGVERLTEWLCDHAGVIKTAYTMAVSRLLPVAMVARALYPGIQCRSVVIFEGKQDIGKSELVKRLADEAWYRIVDSTLEGKEAHMLMKGVWIVELAEMDVMLRTEESRVKSFVTMCNDEYVPKYANDPVKMARRSILVGTINPEGDGSYLRDQTGATRYYPVRVDTIDLDAIAAARDQLFAEALAWFQAYRGDWWQMPEDASEELADVREARRKEGVYEGPRLKEWLAKVQAGTTEVLAPFHTEDALRYCFQIPPERWNASIKDQVGKAIGKLGWYVKSSRARGDVQRLWHPKV